MQYKSAKTAATGLVAAAFVVTTFWILFVNQELKDFSQQTPASLIDMNNKEEQIRRRLRLRNFCLAQNDTSEIKPAKLLFSDRQAVVYCLVPKVACTNWKRFMLLFDGRVKDLFEIKNKMAIHSKRYHTFKQLDEEGIEQRKNQYYSFMFARHPLERVLSAWRNKLLDPYNTIFQRNYGAKILKLYRRDLSVKEYQEGKNVTFKEFVDYLIHTHKTRGPRAFNDHWAVITDLCTPCSFKFDYLGKMETLLEDAEQVLKEVGADPKLKFPAEGKDKYQTDTKSIMTKYYSQISESALRKLVKIYEKDFFAFGYDMPENL